MLMWNSFTAWINQVLAYMGGCLGCYTKSTPITSVDEPAKGLQTQWQTAKRASDSEDFWSTSTHDLENIQSHRSFSSISASIMLIPNGGADSTSNHSEFVNHGLIQWNQTRLQWVTSKKSENNQRAHKPKPSWNESLLGTSRSFSRPVPLAVMVEDLVDIWDHEGLYG